MKIYVMVDMEGISGICRASQVRGEGLDYQEGRRYLTAEVNACVDGCFAGGATQVLIQDTHSAGHNLIWDQVDGRAELIQGRLEAGRMPDLAGCDGLILLGYHAMAGTPEAVLEHTMSSAGWQNFWLNGRRAGELAIDAGIAGDLGIPVIMASGCDKLCREARHWLKGAVTVTVKQGRACEGARLLSAEVAHARIRAGAAKAVGKCSLLAPLTFKSPVRMRLEVVSRGLLPRFRPNTRILDGRTFEVTAESVEAALFLLCGA
jgi:D-amino peptidase